MSNHWSADRGRDDEQHTDPIGYPVGDGSEFQRAIADPRHGPRMPHRSEPHPGAPHPNAREQSRYDDSRHGETQRGEVRRSAPVHDETDYDETGYDKTAYDGATYDDEPGLAVPQEVGVSRAARRRDKAAASRRRRGRTIGVVLALVVILAVAGGGFLLFDRFAGGTDAPEDFAAGSAGPSVVVHVNPGDTASQIGTEAADKGVVASSGAFLEAAIANSSTSSVQPGYYLLPTNVPGTQAVSALVDPASRVGNVVISEGRQLHDSRDVNTGAVKKGIYTLVSEASCVDRSSSGSPTCISYDDLNSAGALDDPDALGVPDWARERVETVPDRDRQLEGLISAGTWDFDPTATPGQILQQLVSESATEYENTGILGAGAKSGLDPYDTLVAASLVERESLPPDFSKVARVILNRLAEPQKLEFDSTVNYALDTTEVATTDADRATVTPWNTYAKEGLPATPISSPSIGAVQAMESPADGDWLYFVTINAAGETLFTRSYDEHLANIGKVEGGFLDSGR